MAESDLGPEVRRLVVSHLASMDHLDVLLLLKNSPAPLGVSDVVRESKRPEALIESALEDLRKGGLITAHDADDGARVFKYDPQSEILEGAVDELAQMYNERPVTLIRAIYDRPASPVTSFADAFRVRRGKT